METPEQAIEVFLTTDIDYLVFDGLWISKRQTPILSYAEHSQDLPVETLPRGLAPEQPDVLELMRQLDQALFSATPRPAHGQPKNYSGYHDSAGVIKKPADYFHNTLSSLEYSYILMLYFTQYTPHIDLSFPKTTPTCSNGQDNASLKLSTPLFLSISFPIYKAVV